MIIPFMTALSRAGMIYAYTFFDCAQQDKLDLCLNPLRLRSAGPLSYFDYAQYDSKAEV
jgi:hypothetical protein